MVHFSAFLVALVAVSTTTVHAAPAPLTKRIAQVISDSTKKWEAACDTAGGAQQCNTIAVNAFGTLLAAAGPCDQQDNADKMIDLAKQLNNDADMIKFAQIFAQQPRNTPTSQSVPYCQTAPKNAELNGLFQCQFAGANPTTFVGGTAVGGAGTVPLGMSSPLSPAGSCPAHPAGPIADGTQLVDQVSSSGASSSGSGSSSGSSSSSGGNNNSGSGSGNSTDSGSSGSSDDSGDDGSDCGNDPANATATATVTVTVTAGAASATATAAPSSGSSSSGSTSGSSSSSSSSFLLQNGKDAQALNKKFASLDASSTCTEGDQACIGSAFAQCVGGKFVQTQCTSTLTCAALPLVNKAGTTIACITQNDAAARIAATGATGGITGDGSSAPASSAAGSSDGASTPAAATPASASAAAAATFAATSGSGSSSGSGFKLQNGKDAQALNKQFQALTADSSCTDGQDACIGTAFAQCVGGKFVQSQCGSTLTCAALPLVNSPGTSIACVTQAEAAARIAATGATGGVTGN